MSARPHVRPSAGPHRAPGRRRSPAPRTSAERRRCSAAVGARARRRGRARRRAASKSPSRAAARNASTTSRCASRSASGAVALAADPAARPAGELARRLGRAVDDRRDLVERHGEHVVQHEREPLGRRQRLEHDEQREPDRVGQQRLVLGVGAVGAVDDRLGQAQRRAAPRAASCASAACSAPRAPTTVVSQRAEVLDLARCRRG